MFCNKCHNDLGVFGEAVELMSKCPMCGQELTKEQKFPEQKTFAELCKVLKEKSSVEIFGSTDLLNELTLLDLSFQNARDRMSILCIRDIPNRIYQVSGAPKGEQEYELGACHKILVDDLGISVENSTSMLNGLQNVLFEKPVAIPAAYNDSSFTDPRDGHVYKTVRIGSQVWMAENLCYAMDGAYVYNGQYDKVGVYGYFYPVEALEKVAPPGWHVPSKQEFEELLRTASMDKTNTASLVLTSKVYKGVDSLGFNALYAGYYNSRGKGLDILALFACEKGVNLRIEKGSTFFCDNHSECGSVRLIKDKV